MILAYVLELVLERHFLAALLVALLGVIGCWPARGGRWRCLRVEADGRLLLISDGGTSMPASLGSGSLRLGRHLLLVLRSDTGNQRILLGPDNLDPGQLAALKRRLPD